MAPYPTPASQPVLRVNGLHVANFSFGYTVRAYGCRKFSARPGRTQIYADASEQCREHKAGIRPELIIKELTL